MKIRTIKCKSNSSPFAKLCCKNKIIVLKQLAGDNNEIYGCVIEPANNIEDKYTKIRQCINECKKEEIEIIKIELGNEKMALINLGKYRDLLLPLSVSFLSVVVAASTLSKQIVDSADVGMVLLIVPFVILAACYLVGWLICSRAKIINCVLEIIESQNAENARCLQCEKR